MREKIFKAESKYGGLLVHIDASDGFCCHTKYPACTGEVVRCRDCGYSNDDPSCTHPRWRHGQHGVVVYPPVDLDGFCWLGERRG